MNLSSLTPDKQMKFHYWLDIIHQCRSSGLTNRAWCEQNNISLKSYYYWIAKIRKLALENLPRKENGMRPMPINNTPLLPESSSEFTKISIPKNCSAHSSPTAVMHVGDVSIDIFEDTLSESIITILKAVQSC